MRKLIERMTSENVEKLRAAEKNFPYSVGSTIKQLETQGYWMELTYDAIGILVSHLGLSGYDPSTINSVFENE
jgi:formamidopyrimidine-DNA glycosylase